MRVLLYRGGVENIRLEAKAKDTKNPRPKPRPRTALLRTNPLETNDSNARCQSQGPRTQAASVLKKKKKTKEKVFRKIFQAIYVKKKVFNHIFWAISRKNSIQKFFSSSLQNFNVSKNSAVPEPRTEQFLRT